MIGRIFGRHKQLIAALMLAGLLGGLAIHLGEAPQYTATARLVLDTTDPEDQAQSGVIADTARAIATGPSLVADALREIGPAGTRPRSPGARSTSRRWAAPGSCSCRSPTPIRGSLCGWPTPWPRP